MDIGVIGVNHNLAPISVREKVSFTDTRKIEAINSLLDKDISEIVILSTCNRSEIYIRSNNIEDRIKIVEDFYEEYFNEKNIKPYLFSKSGKQAIDHLFEVTAGLDSIVLGEDQILGQVKDAHEFSMKLGASKKVFNKLFREAVTTSKEIKSTTKISQQPLSISYIGIKLLKDKLGSLENKNALVVGFGKMSKLTMNHLKEEKVNTIYLANRSHGKYEDIGDDFRNVIPIDYNSRYETLKNVDIVVSATASPHTVLKAEEIPKLDHKIFMMDIALPRDIDSKINEFENIEVYDIDDLKKIHDENDSKRNELAMIGRQTIHSKVEEFIEWLDVADIDPTIQSLNEKCFEIRQDTLDYIFRKVDLDSKDQRIIDKMIGSALKRLVREPILNLKQVKDKGKREEYIKLIEELFEI
ncbi:glutamyl-tRNA reductase [Romboutsia ilealis]|uniref:Glutamyl-tRNA reductase n=1 Tax=Romboutsia faecis TaxID=2764597 RepID=A0ABR7JTL9_9FIRM|nr:glutamyl-tRNA reductase [Romboutsia faecis]MBC5998259.1 glutamyl-tRNA reductase [Romboutsia faecis]MRN25953.1 glutamyl-tRNA reductase [Romboutsia ilealis]